MTAQQLHSARCVLIVSEQMLDKAIGKLDGTTEANLLAGPLKHAAQDLAEAHRALNTLIGMLNAK